MKGIFNLFIFWLLVFFCSCEEDFVSPDPVSNPVSNFEYLWEDVQNRYSYFDLKSIDWETIRKDYRPLVKDNMSNQELFDLMADMLYQLKDGHVNLTSDFDRSRNWDWFLGHPSNFNGAIVERNYLGSNYRITGPLRNQVIDSVLYIYYSSFANTISTDHLEVLMERASTLKGIIIDVRNNGGGNLNNARLLASCFTDQKVAYARERRKTGPEANDFSDWQMLTFPAKKGRRFKGKVVVLSNRACYSATTFFAQMMKALPNVLLLGDQTGGGGGAPSSGELPNGWQYRLSVTQTVNLEGEHIEMGVPADIAIKMDQRDLVKGKDTLIEAALDILR
ncbi:MAG: S41 family peptidase [Anditalea sp.]